MAVLVDLRALLERPAPEVLEVGLEPQQPALGLAQLREDTLGLRRIDLGRSLAPGGVGGGGLLVLLFRGLVDGGGRLAQRLLELGTRREGAFGGLLGQGFPALGGLRRLPVRFRVVDLDLLLAAPAPSCPVMTSERKPTSGITRS